HLDDPPERVVSLMPSHSETVLALGAEELLGGVDDESTTLAGLSELPEVGNGFARNLELIVSLEPDLLLVDGSTGIYEQLEDLRLRAFAGTPETLQEVLDFNLTAGRLFGRTTQAIQLLNAQSVLVNRVHQATAGVEPVEVYVELDPTPFSAGPGSYIDDLLNLTGGVNVVPAAEGPRAMLSPQLVVAAGHEGDL